MWHFNWLENMPVILYPIASLIIFYSINNVINHSLLVFLSIFMYLFSIVFMLSYFESKKRDKMSDIGTIVILTIVTVAVFFMKESINISWLLAYFPLVPVPAAILYICRKKNIAAYLPTTITALIVSGTLFLSLTFNTEYKKYIIELSNAQIEQFIAINEAQKRQIEASNNPNKSEQLLSISSQISQLKNNKETLVQSTINLMPALLFIVVAIIMYISDRMKPLIKDGIFISRPFRLPDSFVWILIAGTACILAPQKEINYIAYNTLLIFGALYFFQGMQILNGVFVKYNVSVFIRSLIIFFIILNGLIFIVLISLLGLFSIWFMPAWLNSNQDISNGKNKQQNNKED